MQKASFVACTFFKKVANSVLQLLEMTTAQQLGFSTRPVGLLNVHGFWDPFLVFLDKCVDEGFIKPGARQILVVGRSPAELLDKLEAYEPPVSLIAIKAADTLRLRLAKEEAELDFEARLPVLWATSKKIELAAHCMEDGVSVTTPRHSDI